MRSQARAGTLVDESRSRAGTARSQARTGTLVDESRDRAGTVRSQARAGTLSGTLGDERGRAGTLHKAPSAQLFDDPRWAGLAANEDAFSVPPRSSSPPRRGLQKRPPRRAASPEPREESPRPTPARLPGPRAREAPPATPKSPGRFRRVRPYAMGRPQQIALSLDHFERSGVDPAEGGRGGMAAIVLESFGVPSFHTRHVRRTSTAADVAHVLEDYLPAEYLEVECAEAIKRTEEKGESVANLLLDVGRVTGLTAHEVRMALAPFQTRGGQLDADAFVQSVIAPLRA